MDLPPTPQDTAAPNTEPDVSEAARKARAAMDSLRDLLVTLDPPSDVMLKDAFGGEHKVRSVVPARAQVRAMGELEKLASMPGGQGLQEFAQAARGSGMQAAIQMLVRAATNEAVLDGLCAAFTHAHPQAVAAAQKQAAAAGVTATHVADLFPVEEVVAGLVPFLIRLVSRLVGLVTKAEPDPQP